MKNEKYLLFERIQLLNPSHHYPLNENLDRIQYKRMLKEEKNNLYNNLLEIFIERGKLTGNLKEDSEYLREFSRLMEEEDDFDPFAHLKNTEKINEKEDCLLSISLENQKLDHPYISLPAGYTCPFADKCKTLVPRDREKLHGKLVQDLGDMRCYAGSEEARYPAAQKMRWRNRDLLDQFDKEGKINLILKSLKHFEQNHGPINVFRIHESGDFYDMEYFDAWLEVARRKPDTIFYAYTKSLPFWVKRLGKIPDNMKLIASVGGKRDDLINKHELKHAVVVNSPEEAKKLKLPIDIDDTLAYNQDGNFALLIHGAQKAGTEKSKAAYRNREILKKIKRGEFDDL